jgi:hypothetical protein
VTLRQEIEFPLVPMWALAPGSAHARPSAQAPINPSGNFSTHVPGRAKNTKTFRILSTFLFQKTPPEKSTPWGVPRICFYPKSYFFCDLKPHAKFQNSMITPFGRTVTGAERKKTPLIVTANASSSGQLINMRMMKKSAAAYIIKTRIPKMT